MPRLRLGFTGSARAHDTAITEQVIVSSQPTNAHNTTVFSYVDMADQSISSHLRTIFELALRDYEIKTQMSLANHPLVQKLENSHSVESITILLQDQVGTFGDFRGRDRIVKSIRSTVSFLYKLEVIATLVDGISLVCQKTLITAFRISDVVLQPSSPAKALFTGLDVLLAVCVSRFSVAYSL